MQESGRLRKVRRFFFQSLINEIITLVWVRRLIRHFRVSRANAERVLTPVSLCKRPLGEHPSPETGGMLLSACQSYFPDRLRTYFILPCFTVPHWFLGTSHRCEDEGLSLERCCNNLVVFVCHCLILLPQINKFLWVHVICRVKEIDQIGNVIQRTESSLLYAHVSIFLVCFFSPNCLHLSRSSLRCLLFPLLHPPSSCACSVWLCVPKTADEFAGLGIRDVDVCLSVPAVH